jgi:hypothetical protein
MYGMIGMFESIFGMLGLTDGIFFLNMEFGEVWEKLKGVPVPDPIPICQPEFSF